MTQDAHGLRMPQLHHAPLLLHKDSRYTCTNVST